MDDNGILATVAGDVIGAAAMSLPAPATATELQASVTTDAGWVGRVTITFVRARHRHGKTVLWSWRAIHAAPAA